MRELSPNTTESCIEAHFRDLEALKRLSEVVPLNLYACYCWRPIAAPIELRDAEFARIRNARLVFDHTSISVEEGHALPAYDWDGRPRESVTRLVRQHSKPLSEHDKQPSVATVELCSEIAVSVLGSSLTEPVKTVTEWTDEGRAHSYLMTVPKSKAALIATELSSRLALAAGVASFEFLGTASQIEEIQRRGHYSFGRFPANCCFLEQVHQQFRGRVLFEKIDADTDLDRARQYGVFTLPTTIVVNGQGVVKQINYGLTDSHKLSRQLKTIL